MNLLAKTLQALWRMPRAFCRTPRPRVVMTLLVKNEEELLEQNLRFHHAMGVDGFIITDNNSTDRTPDIIARYRSLGWVWESIEEHGTDYRQKQWVDRMIQLARTRHGADWVINADADEFWLPPAGTTLKGLLASTRANVLRCEVRGVYPTEGLPWTEWEHTVRRVESPEDYGLSPYSVFNPTRHKVMHRADGYLQIAMGNHKVCMLPRLMARSPLVVYHYNVRDREAFVRVKANGGLQLQNNPKRHVGRHWRYFYALFEEGKLGEEYDRVVGRAQYARLCADGYVVRDNPMPAIFRKLNSDK